MSGGGGAGVITGVGAGVIRGIEEGGDVVKFSRVPNARELA